MDEAARLQKQYPKKIIIDMYTTWCGPCRMLDRNTFSNKSLAEYVNANFYAVKFNAEGNEIVNFKGQQFSNPNYDCLLYTSPSPRDATLSRMPSSA